MHSCTFTLKHVLLSPAVATCDRHYCYSLALSPFYSMEWTESQSTGMTLICTDKIDTAQSMKFIGSKPV